jgi:chitinase
LYDMQGCEGCDVWGNTENCVGHTESVGYNFLNATARAAFVQKLVTTNHDYGYDGISLDIEGGVSPSQGDGLTAIVTELRQALPTTAQLSFYSMCLAHSPEGNPHAGLNAYPGFQMAKLEEQIDFFFPSC